MTRIEFIWWIATPTCECFLKMGGPISTLLTSILITFDSFDSMHTLLSYCVFPYSKWPLQYFIYLLSYAIVMALTSKISLIFVQKRQRSQFILHIERNEEFSDFCTKKGQYWIPFLTTYYSFYCDGHFRPSFYFHIW